MSDEAKRIRSILHLVNRLPATASDGHAPSTGLSHLDDCAVIPIGNDLDLVVGTDFVRGEGFDLFKLGRISWKDIGYYLVAANASDLAAMGARPTGMLLVFRTPGSLSALDHNDAVEGVVEACAEFGMPLLGGDSGGYCASVLSATAIGTCPRGKALLRRNGRVGDFVYLSDHVGAAAAASAWFLRGHDGGRNLDIEAEEALLSSWRRPKPALALGAMLVDQDLSSCAIDTSDGLKAAARQLAEASAVDVVLQPDAIPISPDARKVADLMNLDPLALAAGDSVDFRLLFTSPPDRQLLLQSAFDERGWPLYQVGELRPPSGDPSVYVAADGGLEEMPGIEWDQSETTTIDRLLGGKSGGGPD